MNTPLPALDQTVVGPYRVIAAIGAGGTARIDLARIDRAYGFQRHVVLKRPLEHLRNQPAARASLQREARLGGQLRHPNLVAVLDAGEHDGYDYLVLEYVDGASLRELTLGSEAGRLRDVPLAFSLAVVRDAAHGLHHAHELCDDRGSSLGLVHRDVSPSNLLLGLDGAVKVADFGIAKETHVHTLSGSMQGTVSYMAPEMCRGHAFDRRADIWSLGVVLYELITGIRPFHADNDVAALHRVLAATVTRPRRLRASIPSALEEIVMTALAPDATKRFATALELADALDVVGADARALLVARRVAEVVARNRPGAEEPDPARFDGSASSTLPSGPPPTVQMRRVEPATVEMAIIPDDLPTDQDVLALDPTRQTFAAPSASITSMTPVMRRLPSRDESLVALLTALPDEPVAPTFGEVAEPLVVPPPVVMPVRAASSRRWMGPALGVGAAGIAAGVIAALIAFQDPAPRAIITPVPVDAESVTVIPTDAATAIDAATDAATATDFGGSDETVDLDAIDIDPSHPATPHHSHSRTSPPDAGTPPPPPPPPDAPAAVHWSPDMLLPTDRGSGAHK